MKRSVFFMMLGVSYIILVALCSEIATACPRATERDFIGYWRNVGDQPFNGGFEPAKENLAVEFRDGSIYSYENGRVTDTDEYQMRNEALVIPSPYGPFNSSYFFPNDCNKNILWEGALLDHSVFKRAKKP